MWESQPVSPLLSPLVTLEGAGMIKAPLSRPRGSVRPQVPCYLDPQGAPEHPAGIVCPRKQQLRAAHTQLGLVREMKGNNGWGWASPQGAWTPASESHTALPPSGDTSQGHLDKTQQAFLNENPETSHYAAGGYFQGKSHMLNVTPKEHRPTNS